MSFPTEMATEFKPLTLDTDLGERGNDALLSLAQHGFVVATGVHPEHLDRLAEMAGQDHVVEFCPNDLKRFSTEALVTAWQQKRRVMVGIYDAGDGINLVEPGAIASVRVDDVTKMAWGWGGPEKNKHIPQAGVTTAYRVSREGSALARERRFDEADRFKLGYPLGELVTAVLVTMHDVDPRELSLETWKSNKANQLYDMMGYGQPKGVEPMPDRRPTLQPLGWNESGEEVFYDDAKRKNVVWDERLFKVLVDHPLLGRAAA